MEQYHYLRINWIDWMKSIGIYLVVLGHFYTNIYIFIYTFHMPLFFIISGFLCKHEDNNRVFWKKLWYNLIIPMLIICLINNIYDGMKVYGLDIVYVFKVFKGYILNVPFAMVNCLGSMWFIYTLVVIKIIYQSYCNNKIMIGLSIVFLIATLLYNRFDLSRYLYSSNAIVDVFTAFPFFMIGNITKKYKKYLNEIKNKIILFFIFSISLGIVYVCGVLNQPVWMFQCGYGDNIFLFLTGGIFGTIAVFCISKLIGSYSSYITKISTGTIIILGFHHHLINIVRNYFPVTTILDYVFSFIIIGIFIPLIYISEKYFPLIIGKYRVKSS